MTLAEFLARAGWMEFRWGAHDCLLWLADWVAEQHGQDPAAHLRGRYKTRLGCARVLSREGGVLAVVSDCASRAGLRRTETPGQGAVGVVEAMVRPGELAPVGGIYTGRRWAMLGLNGLITGPAPVVAAWEV